ncbi:MAG TPA: M3 family metallopeptidase, partial [Pyrinomonadaceae bacterium]|nr:M3 family metallopeptidase [Pyrinomonadaceae bacterium]
MKLNLIAPALLFLTLCLVTANYPPRSSASASAAANPFFSESTLPFHAPPFDKIKDSDYAPAIEEGMKDQLVETEKIADDPTPPTFVNTFEAMERSGALLTRVTKVFFNLTQSNTSDTLQKIKSDEAPKLAAHSDAIFLNAKLFARVKALYNQRDSLKLDRESRYLVERYYKAFVRAGALLSEADKETLRGLNQEEAKLTTKFEDDVLAETNNGAVVIDNKADLDGLSEADIAAAAERAKERGLTGKWVLALQNTTQQPAMTFLKNRAVRDRLFQASVSRANHGGENDTKAIVSRLAQLRAQRAKLLGYPDHATFILDDQMAKTPQAAEQLLTGIVPAATAKARNEAARMQKLIDAEKGGFTLGPQDWEYYAEKVRKAEYD